MKLDGRTFIVTGGASGLGLATVEDIINHSGYVSIWDMDSTIGDGLVKKLGSRAHFQEVDVTNTESIASALTNTMKWAEQNNAPLGGVVAGAGVGNPAKMLDKNGTPISMDSIDFVLNINLRGVLDTVRQTLPAMVANKPEQPDGERGVIILVSSSAAFDGQPGQVSYAASKGAIRSLTLPMARDLARYGIRVVTIAPSLFESRMTAALGEKAKKSLERVMEFPVRAGKPVEFASLVREGITNVMLNGTVIRLDGAMRMPSKM